MALAFTLVDSWEDGKRVHVIGQITASGNYVTGGDTLDMSGIGASGVPATLPPKITWIDGQSGYDFVYIPGSAQNNGKVKMFTCGTAVGAFPELAAGAYPAAITGDTIVLEAVFPRLQ